MQPDPDGGIGVDRRGDVEELDDDLREPVGRRGLAREEKRPRGHVEVGVRAEAVVEDDDAERVEQLPLVFVDALDLAIEDRVRVDDLPGRRAQPVGESRLGLALGVPERSRKPASSASGASRRSSARSVIQPLPMASVIASASAGFASSSQRRGVTPFVLLLNRSGKARRDP